MVINLISLEFRKAVGGITIRHPDDFRYVPSHRRSALYRQPRDLAVQFDETLPFPVPDVAVEDDEVGL